jgi:hypothetical protein
LLAIPVAPRADQPLNVRLGYPADSKLLIINADDLAMHDDAEMRAVTVNYPVWDAAWRQRDVDVISSPEFRKALADNHVILIGWRQIQRLIRKPA